MTTPEPHGYPDWQRQFSVADVLFFQTGATSTSVDVTRGPFYTGNNTHLGVRFFSNNNGFRLTLDWFADAALTKKLATSGVEIAALGAFHQTMVVLGPWVRATISPGATVPASFGLTLWAAAGPFMPLDLASAGILVSNSQVVNAGATVHVTTTRAHSGAAVLTWRHDPATWAMALSILDRNGAVATQFLNVANAIGASGIATIYLPPSTIDVTLQNTSGANGSMRTFLTALPSSLG